MTSVRCQATRPAGTFRAALLAACAVAACVVSQLTLQTSRPQEAARSSAAAHRDPPSQSPRRPHPAAGQRHQGQPHGSAEHDQQLAEANLLPPTCMAGWTADEQQAFATASHHTAPATVRLQQPQRPADTSPASEPNQSSRPPSVPRVPESVQGVDRLLSDTGDTQLDDSLLDDDLLDDEPGAGESPDPLRTLSPLEPRPRQESASPATPPSRWHQQGLADQGAGPSADQRSHPEADPHLELFLEHQYPGAETCAKCHPKHYDEWRVSAHAYSMVSPMFHRFEQAMQELTRGTIGAFCIRCHSPVGVQLDIPAEASILDAPSIVREGITCIACHRVNEQYGRTHGDRRIEPGNIFQPISGSSDGRGVRQAHQQAAELKLKRSPDQAGPGQPMHDQQFFAQLGRHDFCTSCHQVAVHPGIWLEIVHAQYRAGPAHAKGISCQDCHMGSVPGKPEGYEHDHCAIINDQPFGEPRKHANHTFWGPNYSIAHPGIFPHNKDAKRYTPRQWLAFDDRGGWGTPEFEKSVPAEADFPPPWDHRDDRIDGRKIIDANLRRLDEKRASNVLTLAAAGRVEGPLLAESTPLAGRPLRFSYRVSNISEGHNMPTGSLGAQPQMWLNVALVGPDGNTVWESGYLDSQGDLADLMSEDVARGRIARDAQLLNLQTKFLINNVRGTDREVPVPLNFSLDQLVFLRPGAIPISVLNHPPLIRMEAHSIPPLDHRIARYRIPADRVAVPGQYRLSVRLRSRPEPPYLMRFLGASPEMIRRLNENIIDFEASSTTLRIAAP